MKQQVKTILGANSAPANEITHNLSELGGGDMRKGLHAVWKDGMRQGSLITASVCAVAFIGVSAIHHVVSRKKHRKCMMRECCGAWVPLSKNESDDIQYEATVEDSEASNKYINRIDSDSDEYKKIQKIFKRRKNYGKI